MLKVEGLNAGYGSVNILWDVGFEVKDGEIVAILGSNATDLSSQVLALKQADPDAILCDSYIGDATLFVQTLKEQNYKPKMIVAKANGFTDPSFIPNLGASANGVASVVEFNPDLTNGVEINEEFKKVYNVNMNGHSAESYTVVWLFKAAIEKAGSADGAAVRDALASLSIDGSFPGGRKIVLPYSKIEVAPEYELVLAVFADRGLVVTMDLCAFIFV